MSHPEFFRCQWGKGPHRTDSSRTTICQIVYEIRNDLADRCTVPILNFVPIHGR
jgi:hypothetical protein